MDIDAKGFFNKPTSSTNQYVYEENISHVSFDSEPHRICGLWNTTPPTVQLFTATLTYGKKIQIPYPLRQMYISKYDDSGNTIKSQKIKQTYKLTQTENNWNWDFAGVKGHYESGNNTINMQNYEYLLNASSDMKTKKINNVDYNFFTILNPLNSTFLAGDYSQLKYRDSDSNVGFSYSYSIPMFKTENECILYVNDIIDDSSAVNKDSYYDPDADENDENDNDKNASKFEATPSNTPQVRPTDIQGASNYYCVNAANVNAFVNWLWNDLIKEGSLSDWLLDSITKINGNLYSCITGLRLFPCNISKHLASTEPTGINLGRFTTEFTVIDARSYNPKIGELEYTIPAGYNNFLDYQPYTTGLLYLPFVGFTQLDMTVFQPKSTMKIECYVDITTGVIDYVIYLKTEKGYSLIEHHSGTCGIEIPMSYDNAANWLQNFVGGAIKDGVNTIGGKGATSLGEMAISATGGLLDSFETPTSYNVGAPSPSNGLYFPFKPHIVIKRPTYSRPKSYSKNVGYPCMKSLKPKTLTGYTVFQNPQLTFGHTVNSEGQKVLPTKEEMDLLYQLMTEGVYL